MFALVKGVYEEISKRDEYFITILGLDGAGKTVSKIYIFCQHDISPSQNSWPL